MCQSTQAIASRRLQVGLCRPDYDSRLRYGRRPSWQVLTCSAWLETNGTTLVLLLVRSLILNAGSWDIEEKWLDPVGINAHRRCPAGDKQKIIASLYSLSSLRLTSTCDDADSFFG
jgi:hypothetical protein